MFQKQILQITVWLILGAAVVGLAVMAFLGLSNRYWSDDWCYERDFAQLGIPPTLGGYFFTGEDAVRGYSTNRFSLTLITAALYAPGMVGTQLLATLVILLLSGSLYFVMVQLPPVRGSPRLFPLAAAALFAYLFLYLSPARFQILYWRAGVHYTATIIVALVLLGMILRVVNGGRPAARTFAAVSLLAFLGGGLSETGCVYLAAIFSGLLVWAWLAKRRHEGWAIAFPLIAATVVAVLLAMLALIASPSNDRYRVKVDHPIPLNMIPAAALEFGLAFIRDSIRSLPLPLLVFILSMIALAILLAQRSPLGARIKLREALARAGLSMLVAVLLIVIIQVPAAYFYGAPLDARGQTLSRFTMLAALAIVSGMLGLGIGSSSARWPIPLAVTALLVASAYTARLITRNYGELAGFVRRGALWDARDAMIRKAVRMGETHIEIPVIDTFEIDTRDLMRSIVMDEWVSNCATEYYGAEAFRAIPP
jgi:hypothetical protein